MSQNHVTPDYGTRRTVPTPPPVPKPGMIVEDTTVVAGIDEHGAPVIRPKSPVGRADESVNPTDARERP